MAKPGTFRKGIDARRNLIGRPRKAGSLLEALENAPTANVDAVAALVWKHARRGEVWAINLLFDRLHGRPRQVIEQPGAIPVPQIYNFRIQGAEQVAETTHHAMGETD